MPHLQLAEVGTQGGVQPGGCPLIAAETAVALAWAQPAGMTGAPVAADQGVDTPEMVHQAYHLLCWWAGAGTQELVLPLRSEKGRLPVAFAVDRPALALRGLAAAAAVASVSVAVLWAGDDTTEEQLH